MFIRFGAATQFRFVCRFDTFIVIRFILSLAKKKHKNEHCIDSFIRRQGPNCRACWICKRRCRYDINSTRMEVIYASNEHITYIKKMLIRWNICTLEQQQSQSQSLFHNKKNDWERGLCSTQWSKEFAHITNCVKIKRER